MEEKTKRANRGAVSMGNDEHDRLFAALLKLNQTAATPNQLANAAFGTVSGILTCLEHSVQISQGTGESAAQTMARAKDLFTMTEAWATAYGKVRK